MRQVSDQKYMYYAIYDFKLSNAGSFANISTT